MLGLVEMTRAALEGDSIRKVVQSLALEFVGEMPAK